MFRGIANKNCENKENVYSVIPPEKKTTTITIDKTSTSSTKISIAKVSYLETYASEYRSHDSINERKCPDCGRNWNPIIQQLDFLCLSPPPLVPKHEPSPNNYQERTPPHQLNKNFNDSTFDYESSSEFGSSDDTYAFAESSSELDRSCESLPSVNLSFTDDM